MNHILADLQARHSATDARHKLIAAKHLEERRALLRDIGGELKDIRTRTGLTLVSMAKMLKISRGCLNAAESPDSVSRYLSPETVFAYADAYVKVEKAIAGIHAPRRTKFNLETTP
jgi:DNA-binding XRE family transcriptional regulator